MDDKNMDKRKEIVSERCFNISNPNFIMRIRLNTENYPRWKHALEMFAKECKLMKHLLKPPPTNPSEDWVSHDAMLHRLITETMEEEIALQVFKCSTAYSIWSYLKEMFEGKFNANRVFDTWRALNKLERGNRSVSFYYGEIKKLESELLSIYPISSEEKGWKTYHDHMMVMTFLAGLGPEYDSLHPKILGGSDVPSLADAYKIILSAYPSSVVEGTSNSTVKEEEDKSALISSYVSRGRGKGSTRGRGRGRIFPGGKGRGSDRFCSHCEMIGHTKDFCYSLHPELRSQKAAKYATRDMTYTTSTSHGTTGLSEEEISRLRTLLAESTPDLKTEEIIDSGRESGDLYHFDGRPLKVVHFRSLERPKEEDFCLELSKLFTYDNVVERVARQLGLDDPSKIRLTSHNCNSQQPKPQPINYRGVEHLSDMLVHYNQTSDILYYEVLDIPLPELQCLKTLKVAFHHATKDEVVIHSIRLPKNCTVDDLIDVLKTKVELSYPNAALRLLEVFYHKIYKIFPPSEKIENINDQYWTLRAEEIPEEEKNFGPHDRLIHVYHFMKDPNQNQMQVQNFGEPFFLVIHEGETLAEVKARIQKKLQVPDEEFSKWKFVFLSPGRPEYLQDSDIVSIRFQRRDVYGDWEQCLGLEHADTAPKRLYTANQNRHAYKQPVKIYN